MGDLSVNKFLGAALATFLLLMGLNELSGIVFGGGGHHGAHDYANMNEWAESNFHGYRIDIAETKTGGSAEEEPVFDLGLALANADWQAGETVLQRQCAVCHSWDEGGANGTGPNLYGIMGNSIAAREGFTYSAALSAKAGAWTYEDMNDWLTNPGSYARGTSMAYAGLRSPRRDADRVNLIAYLAQTAPTPPPYPDALTIEAEQSQPEEVAMVEDIPAGQESTTIQEVSETQDAAVTQEEQEE